MFKYELKYEDFLGNERKETLRFNLTENEVLKLSERDQTFRVDYLAYVSDGKDPVTMYNVVNRIILASYGVLSDDGKVFNKTPEIIRSFEQSAMYDQFLEEMFGGEDTSKFTNFIIGIFPKKYAAALAERIKSTEAELSK